VIFHIALASDWEAAKVDGHYRVSTLGRTLDEEGFIHCSEDRAQALQVAGSFYAAVAEPLLLLAVDDARLDDVRRETPPGSGERFPHVYGPIPVGAVVTVAAFERDGSGRFAWPDGL
jgi:uncharacterized protein (DUF952 family)